MQNVDTVKDKLKKYNQEHLLTFYDELTQDQQEILLDQINKINFEQMRDLYQKSTKKIEFGENKIEPLEYIDKYKLSKEKYSEYYNVGKKTIEQGKYSVVTMAGGQGTRLGHNRS